jgi:outer membrane receptor for Fe3+-dicitrate
LTPTGDYEETYVFKTFNVAAFLENRIQLGKQFSICPGLRVESLETEAEAKLRSAG